MSELTTTGVSGIDKILYGGLPNGASVIVEGAPGTGKTTLGVQFLYHGAQACNEPGIYITFEELPQQIYQDMSAFGWDLRDLEKRNLLRIVSIRPDVLIEQMKEPDGLFEQMVHEIDCRRIVVDSISLFQFIHKDPEEAREVLYSLRNIFRKFSLTALLINEQVDQSGECPSFAHYVVDGVIRLALEAQMNKFRKRTLEITKMRGRKIVEGEHIYRITERGIYLVPALSNVEDVVMTSSDQVSTGIPRLDQLLSGGIPRGSVFILDTNSKANYKYLIGSIVTRRILQGDKVMLLPSSSTTLLDTEQLYRLYDVDMREVCDRDGLYFIEHYERSAQAGFEHSIFDVHNLSNEEYLNCVRKHIAPMMADSMEKGEKWFAFYDLNTIFSIRGADFVKRFFTEEIAQAQSLGITYLALCNFAELGTETASYLERVSNGTIRTWVDGNYQYLQITKSPSGKISEPHLVETIEEKPLIQLV